MIISKAKCKLLLSFLVLFTVLAVLPALASTRGFVVLNESDAIMDKVSAGQKVFDYYLDYHSIHTQEEPLTSDQIVIGYWVLYSHFIQISDSIGNAEKYWFTSIIDCRDKDAMALGACVACACVNDQTGEVALFFDNEYEAIDVLIPENEPYREAKFDNLLYPPNTFRTFRVPGESDISEDSAIVIANDEIEEIIGIQRESTRLVSEAVLMHYEGICSENIWTVYLYDSESEFPAVAKYICAIYSAHGCTWYIAKLNPEKVYIEWFPYELLYVDNHYCNRTIDMTFIPYQEFVADCFDLILSYHH